MFWRAKLRVNHVSQIDWILTPCIIYNNEPLENVECFKYLKKYLFKVLWDWCFPLLWKHWAISFLISLGKSLKMSKIVYLPSFSELGKQTLYTFLLDLRSLPIGVTLEVQKCPSHLLRISWAINQIFVFWLHARDENIS